MFNLSDSFWLLLWAAAALFISSVLLELYIRRRAQKTKTLENPHPDRIEFALHHIRHEGIKEITNDLWEQITGVSHATATRDLSALVEMGMLKKSGSLKGTKYTFVKHGKLSNKI
ncbi:MAG: hypothetical protein WD712_00960 [Candidatus Spechtbacterales bacterium]